MKSLFTAVAVLIAVSSSANAATLGAVKLANSAVMLNPQPIPPGHNIVAGPVRVAPGVAVMLNPQPLPPGLRSRGLNNSH